MPSQPIGVREGKTDAGEAGAEERLLDPIDDVGETEAKRGAAIAHVSSLAADGVSPFIEFPLMFSRQFL